MQTTEPQLAEHDFSHIIENEIIHDNSEQVEQEEQEPEYEQAPPYDNERPPAYKTINRNQKDRTRRMDDISKKPNDKSANSDSIYLLLAFSPLGLGVLIIGTLVKKGIDKRKERKRRERMLREGRT